jgi:hypothetical protein
MIRQDARAQAEGVVTDRYEGPWSRTFARRLLLASLIGGFEMRLMRDQPHSIVIEPVSEVGTAHVRDLRQFSDTRATFKQPEIEASEFDELCAVLVRVNIANGGQDGRSGGLADPGQRHQELGGRSMFQECESLVEPEWCFGQGIDQVACQCRALELVEVRGVLQTNAGLRQVIDAMEGLRAPLPAALARLPLCSEAGAAVAQDRCGCGSGLQEAQRGRLRQVFHEGIALGKREVNGGSQLVAQLADPFLECHVPLHQAVGGLEFRITGKGQKELALAQ